MKNMKLGFRPSLFEDMQAPSTREEKTRRSVLNLVVLNLRLPLQSKTIIDRNRLFQYLIEVVFEPFQKMGSVSFEGGICIVIVL